MIITAFSVASGRILMTVTQGTVIKYYNFAEVLVSMTYGSLVLKVYSAESDWTFTVDASAVAAVEAYFGITPPPPLT